MIKKILIGITCIALGLSFGIAVGQNVDNYFDQAGVGTANTLHIGGELQVDTGGSIDIETGATLEIAGVAITSTAAELNLLDGATKTTAELNSIWLTGEIADISTGASTWVVSPIAGTIGVIYTIIDGTITTVNAGVTFEIGGTAVTGGSITIAHSGSAAGVVDTCTCTALNILAAGGGLEIITDGASTNAVKAVLIIQIIAT